MTDPQLPDSRRFVLPAEYYSGPTPRPVLPQWAAWGCGAVSVFILLIVFGGGIMLSRGGFSSFMDLVLGMSLGEMKAMYEPGITEAQKTALDSEIEGVRQKLRDDRMSIATLQPLLEGIRSAGADGKITAQEVETLRITAERLNQAKPPRR